MSIAVKSFLTMILDTQDKHDGFSPTDICDRCQQPSAAKLFFEPAPGDSLPTIMLCSSHLLTNKEQLAQANITGGFLEAERIWWLEKATGRAPLVVAS